MVNLTQDIFSDSEPSWSPDNNTIYFTSDRRDNPIKNLVVQISKFGILIITQKIFFNRC